MKDIIIMMGYLGLTTLFFVIMVLSTYTDEMIDLVVLGALVIMGFVALKILREADK